MAPRQRGSGHRLPVSSLLAQATSTTTAALAIPLNCTEIVIVGATVKHYVATGTDAALDLGPTNAAIVQVGGSGETLYPHPQHTVLLVEATTGTGTVDVSFYR